jgi:hypothetical protein
VLTTLDHLEKNANKNKQKKNFFDFLKEIRIIFIFFVIVTVAVLVFTNADLFFGNIVSSFKSGTNKIKSIKKSDIYQNNNIA